MKTLTLILCVVALLGALLTFARPAQAADDSRFVRVDIDGIQAKTDLTAHLQAKLNEVAKDAPVALANGDTLQNSFLFPLVTPATFSITLSGDAGKILLAVEGELKISDTSVEYRVLSASLDDQALALNPDAEAISLVVGRVSGSLQAEVTFLAETEADLSLGIDANNDGQFTGSEITSQSVKGLTSSLQTPLLSSIPLTAAYEVVLKKGDEVLASNTGTYDFAKGQNVKGTRFINPAIVAQLSVTHSRIPYVALVPLPNSIFQLPAGTVLSKQQAEESTVDVFKATEGTAPLQPAQNSASQQGNNSAMDTLDSISNFLSHYWPLLAVAGAVLVGLLLTLRLVYRPR